MRKSRICQLNQMKLREHFVAGTTTRTAARLVRVNKTSAAYYYHRLRQLIYQAVADAAPLLPATQKIRGRRSPVRQRGPAEGRPGV